MKSVGAGFGRDLDPTATRFRIFSGEGVRIDANRLNGRLGWDATALGEPIYINSH
jgi:hypothetical protein